VSLRADGQRWYLADEVRTSSYRRAIAEVVKPGDVMLDLGCGTGIFSFYACQAGASRVYAIDDNGLVELAAQFARDNAFADRIIFINGNSTMIELPERVDVVVAEQLGRLGPEAGIFRFFADAHRRLLKPGGTLIPSRMDIFAAAVEIPEQRRAIDFWRDRPAGFDFSAVAQVLLSTGSTAEYNQQNLIGASALIASVSLAADEAAPFSGSMTIIADRAARLDGVGGWFEAQLAPGVRLTNSTLAAIRMRRPNIFLPLPEPVAVEPGDTIAIHLSIIPEQCMTGWTVTVTDRARSVKSHTRESTLRGLLLPTDEVRKTQSDFKPILSGRDDAYRTMLNLCDGARSIAEIAAELTRHYPALFASAVDAEIFVSSSIAGQGYSPYA